MTEIIIRKSENGEYKGFTCKGHSGFAAKGKDIVCASVSVLVINAINSMEKLAEEDMEIKAEEAAGIVRCRIKRTLSEKGTLLMDSMILGLLQIEEQYGNKYLVVKFKEV